jgi:hypothetical protein
MRLEEIIINRLVEGPEDGTFAGLHLYGQDAQKLHQFALDNEIPNPEPADRLHVTVLFSRKVVPDFKPLGKLKSPMRGTPIEARIFGEGEERALVLVLDAPEIVARHKYIMSKYEEATHDHQDYIPHVTLSYNVGDFDPKTLDIGSIGMLTFTEEYTNDIDPGWSGKWKTLDLE